jgi:hypothetical protein
MYPARVLARSASLLLVLALAGCGPRLVRQTVYETERSQVLLRHTVDGGEVVARGRSQPAQIADVRLAHILASITHEDDEGARNPTIRSEHVYELAEGMAKAFEKAGPDDEIVGVAFSRDRRLGIFSDERVTAFRSWIGDPGELIVEFYAIEEALPEPSARGNPSSWEPPATLSSARPAFKLIPADAQHASGARGLAIAWRDDFYRQPVAMRIRDGRIKRRTVLMEATSEELAVGAAQQPLPPGLSDAQRQALDRLDAARREGRIRESEYQLQRARVLEGRLDDPGGAPGTP